MILLLDTAGQLHSACPASWGGTLDGQPFFGDPEITHYRSRRP